MKEVVKKLPYPIKQSIKYAYGAIPPRIRYGKVFWETYNFLQESQWWGKKKLEEYQMGKIKELVNHAYKKVPYYQKSFDRIGLKPEVIKDIGDFRRIPLVSKDIMRNNEDEFLATGYNKSKLKYGTTGGTTGTPFGFYKDAGYSYQREWAFMFTQWNRVGYEWNDKRAILRGDVPRGNRLWEYNPSNNTLVLSTSQMTEDNLKKYVRKIRTFRPDFLHGYPSAIFVLARFVKESGVKNFPRMKAVLAGSEKLYDWQREVIESALNIRAFNWYGQAEQVILAGECECSNLYHSFPEYGVLELVDERGNIIEEPNKLGEIVGTSFNNYVMPFIRYKTGDWGEYSDTQCQCNRNYPLLKRVEGRWLQEMIVGKENNLVSASIIARIALNRGYSNAFDNVEQFQFYQDKKGEVVFNIVKGKAYTENDTKRIRNELLKRLGKDMKLEIRFVDDIVRPSNRKCRFLIQKLPIEFNNND